MLELIGYVRAIHVELNSCRNSDSHMIKCISWGRGNDSLVKADKTNISYFGLLQVDFPTAIGMVVERDDGSTLMEIDGDKGKQGGPTYYIDTNALRVPRENMEAISPLKNGMGMMLLLLLFFLCN